MLTGQVNAHMIADAEDDDGLARGGKQQPLLQPCPQQQQYQVQSASVCLCKVMGSLQRGWLCALQVARGHQRTRGWYWWLYCCVHYYEGHSYQKAR